MISCSPTNYKTFLVGCNVLLLFVGITVLVLGVKMENAMSVLRLINIPMIGKAIKAVIATGYFISLSGVAGISGACFESLRLLMMHLVSLGIIVVMEFSLCVTLMIVKRTFVFNFLVVNTLLSYFLSKKDIILNCMSETAMESTECNNICAASVDAIILDYALPSAGLMMTIIFVEALMIYCSIKLFFYIRDVSKNTVSARHSIVDQDIQMSGVSGSQPTYLPENSYLPQMVSQTQPDYAIPRFVQGSERQEADEAKPPDYNSLSQLPSYLSPLHYEPFSITADATGKEIDEPFSSI